MTDKKMFFLYSKDGKEYVNTCLGVTELAYFLNREVRNVRNTLSRIRKKKIKYINGAGTTFMLITEEDFGGKSNVRK